jgi:hypothetical protein
MITCVDKKNIEDIEMANRQDGELLCEHITEILNNLIVSKCKQIDKNEPVIWDGFLHQITNDEWESMFMAFKHIVEDKKIFLTHHQQRKFDEAYTTFQQQKIKRERCMDVRNRFMNTKDSAWAMIMTIREVVNSSKGRDIPNVDAVKPPEPKPQPTGKRRKINIHATIEIWEDLFDVK